jgi:hypothetical protein
MSATMTLATTRVAVGDPVRVTLTLEAPSGATIRLVDSARAAPIEREKTGAWSFERSGSVWRLRRQETWASFEPGSSPRIQYAFRIEKGSRTLHEARLVSPPIQVVSVLPPGRTEVPPAPLAGTRARPFVPWETALAIVLVVAGLVALFRFVGARRRRGRGIPGDPDEVLRRELSLLEADLGRQEPGDAFYDWLAEITRWYLEQRLAYPAPHQTSFEIVRELREDSRGLPASDIAQTLSSCDGYRFARRMPSREEARLAIESLRRAAARIAELLRPPEESSEAERERRAG